MMPMKPQIQLRGATGLKPPRRTETVSTELVVWVFQGDEPETVGYWACSWICFEPPPAGFPHNKRTMDRAMGPSYPLWHLLESISGVLSVP